MPDAIDAEGFLASLGTPADHSALALPRARRLAAFLASRDDVGARLVEARQRGGAGEAEGMEWLVLSVDVDVGQAPVADIRREEPIAVGFTLADRDWPSTVALRDDFPENVSHQFVRVAGQPVSLCLSEEPWQVARMRWSPGAFIRLLRTWLIGTACGTLHRDDQAVEPFMASSAARVILPADLFEPARQGAPLYGIGLGREAYGPPIYAFDFEPRHPGSIPAVAAVLIAAPKIHGVVRRPPRTLADLLDLYGKDDPNFGATLDDAVSTWLKQKPLHQAFPLLLVQVPMLRHEGEEPERRDLFAFILDAKIVDIGIALDLWSLEGDGGAVLPFNRRPGPYGDSIFVEAAVSLFELGPALAADFNGLEGPSGQSLLAIGAGALGSQVIANLTRMGETVSVIVDEDRLLPHNLARHAIWDRRLLGQPKARAMALMLAETRSGAPQPTAIALDVTNPLAEGAHQLVEAVECSDVVLDMAASIAVSRWLAFDVEGGRRIAAFLSPNGLDLVILAEDRARTTRLDHLEMAVYAAALNNPDMAGHFVVPEGRRYARGCRDVSGRLPQSAIALHAAVAAEQIRGVIESDDASAGVWRLDRAAMTVRHVPLDVRPMPSFSTGDWTVLVTQDLLDRMSAQRAEKLPAETGGVLLGVFDADRRTIHVAAHIPSPPDSVETPEAYIRGAFGTEEAVQAAERATLSMLRYVGEWHSHPEGCPALPSGDDLALFSGLAKGMEVEGHPPVMIIVGGDEVAVITTAAAPE